MSMTDDVAFLELIRKVRRGDGQAAAELVRHYEPAIRRAVRFRLAAPGLRRACDSADICQAVLGSFFVRVATGQYELDTPEQLLKLLATMARNKVCKQVDRQRAARRDHRLLADGPLEHHEVIGPDPTPSRQLAARELLEEAQRRLSPEERQLASWRVEGRDWADIGREVGASPEALRKRLARAVERVALELDLDGATDV
jgi:RNA polymerase sigma-70 factor (ECF subfamily)